MPNPTDTHVENPQTYLDLYRLPVSQLCVTLKRCLAKVCLGDEVALRQIARTQIAVNATSITPHGKKRCSGEEDLPLLFVQADGVHVAGAGRYGEKARGVSPGLIPLGEVTTACAASLQLLPNH